MERANLLQYLASSADELIAQADAVDFDNATVMLREATELLTLGSALLRKENTPNLSVITKEAA